jgi:hypothetical protein
MFEFVERPVRINSSEFPMLHKEPSRICMQPGVQPVLYIGEDVEAQERPQSIFDTFFRRKK